MASEFRADQVIPSSFGLDETTLGPAFRAHMIADSERARLLDRKQSYYLCTQHDWKLYDFDGRPIPQGNPLLGQPMLASQPSEWYVPLRQRRPSAPYRLGRTIVDSFTTLVFGYQRWPTIRCPDDPETELFARSLVDAAGLRTLMIKARNQGGSTGTVCMSWRFHNGRPVVQVHNAKQIYVHAWADREQLIPAHVIEIYRYARDEWDAAKRSFVRNWYWFRRDWTQDADVAFREVLVEKGDPYWYVDEENTYFHGDGFCHFVWGQNLPSDTPEEPDGMPDYEGLYENFDSLDLLNSVLVGGTIKNLDPTLVLKMDPDIVARTGVQKGSDNALMVGLSGDARYMELQGTSVQVGTTLFAKMRETALEVAQCVIPDPNLISAAGTSAVALKVVYAPMLGKADILREQYERMIRQLLRQMLRAARHMLEAVDVTFDENGEPVEHRTVLDLPPQTVVKEMMTVGTQQVPLMEKKEVVPGSSEELVFDWGEYFMPTAQDQQQLAATLTQMVTGQLISQEGGADLAARAMRIDPRADWVKMQREQEKKQQQQQLAGGPGDEFMGGMGAKVESQDELPPGAMPRQPKGADGVVTVNEARSAMGLPPLADRDGDLTLAAYQSKQRALERIAVEQHRREVQEPQEPEQPIVTVTEGS